MTDADVCLVEGLISRTEKMNDDLAAFRSWHPKEDERLLMIQGLVTVANFLLHELKEVYR